MTSLWAKIGAGAVVAAAAAFFVWVRPPAGATKAGDKDPTEKSAARDGLVRLSPDVLQKNKIVTVPAKKTALARDLELVGSATYDADHYALVGPLISGRIVSLRVGVGDEVRRGQVLAELESPDVGEAAAEYLKAKAKFGAAQANLRRERELAAQKVSSERERELAEANAASEKANLEAAVQHLESLGLRGGDLQSLSAASGGRVGIRAPIAGTVLSRHVTLGEAIEAATDAFKIANLKRLWVNLDVYEKDLNHVQLKQKVTLRTEALPGRTFNGHVAYIEPQVDEKTRTSRVRIEIENDDRSLRPGQFISAKLIGEKSTVTRQVLAVPKIAIVTIEGKPIVFVKRGEGLFERQPVETGIASSTEVELTKGVEEGQEVVTEGAFLLKSELLR